MGGLSILQVLLLLRFRLQPNWMHLFAGLSVVVVMSAVGAVAGLIAYGLSKLK